MISWYCTRNIASFISTGWLPINEEIIGSKGYLLGQFLSPWTNHIIGRLILVAVWRMEYDFHSPLFKMYQLRRGPRLLFSFESRCWIWSFQICRSVNQPHQHALHCGRIIWKWNLWTRRIDQYVQCLQLSLFGSCLCWKDGLVFDKSQGLQNQAGSPNIAKRRRPHYWCGGSRSGGVCIPWLCRIKETTLENKNSTWPSRFRERKHFMRPWDILKTNSKPMEWTPYNNAIASTEDF
jgi:hypothetical protein